MKKRLLSLLIIMLAVLMPTKLWAQEPYAVLSEDSTVLTFYYDDQKAARNGMSVGPFSGYPDYQTWYAQRESITSVVFDDSFAGCTTLTSTAYWFYEFENLTSITGISYLKTDNMTDMHDMFVDCSSLTSLDVTSFKTDNVTNMSEMFYRCSSLTSLDVSGFKTDNVTDVSGMFGWCSGLTSLDVSGFKTDNVTDMGGMFWRCSGLTTIDVSGFNTEKVTNMWVMFSDCSGLTSLDVSGFKTDNVTDMSYMFSGCSGLASLDVSGFKTANVTNMREMFYRCSSLMSLDVSGFKTDNVTDMGAMFYGCYGLTSLDVSGFNTDNVTNMRDMFRWCSGLKTIYVGSTWSTSAVTEGSDMFGGCTKIVGGQGTTYDADHIDATYARIDGGPTSETPGYFTRSGDAPYVVEAYAVLSEDSTVLTFYYDGQKAARNGMSVGPFSGYPDYQTWYEQRESITRVVFDASFAGCTTLTSTAYWFYGLKNLTSITGISNLKTDNVTDMTFTFGECSSLASLDVSGFKTDKVTGMSRMFSECSSLTSLDVSGFNTDNVTSMADMFYECSGLASLDVTGFKTDNVTNMMEMFSGCSGLTSLDLSNFNTANVTRMSGMFFNCSGLTSLDVSGFKTDNVTDMYGMFYICSGLTSLDVSGFKTDNVTNMSWMFADCQKLTSLDLGSFKTDNVTNMKAMFDGCSILTSIYVSSEWTTASVTEGSNMFRYCTNLVGGQGTTYDANHTDYTYAHIDGGPNSETPGYFTRSGDAPYVAPEPYAVLSSDSLTVTFYYDTKKTERGGFDINDTIINDENGDVISPYGTATTAVFDASFADYRPTSTAYWFISCHSLTSIKGIENLKTDNVTLMHAMFAGCEVLNNLDVSGFKTDNVVNMDWMFMSCASLTSLDLSSFNTAKVTNMSSMFGYCYDLKTIYASSDWSTAAVTSGDAMFTGCTSLVGGAGTIYDENHVDYTYAHIDGGPSNPGYFTRSGDAPYIPSEPYAVLSGDTITGMTLTFYYDRKKSERNGMGVGPFEVTNYDDYELVNSGWDESREYIATVVFDDSFADCQTITSTSAWFYDFSKLTTIINIGNLKTDNVYSMGDMFWGCESLETIDVSGFNTSNVWDFGGMFGYCFSLKSLDISNFDTSSSTWMRRMFDGCSKLTTLDVSKFKTDNVTNMLGLFMNCSGLTSLDVSGFKTDNVTDISEMFYGCSGLTSLDVSGFNTENVTTMWGMFSDCSSLTSLDVSHFDTKNVTTTTRMFDNCKLLTNLDVSNFNTDNNIGIGAMFRNCASLTSIDVSRFNTSNTQYLWSLFEGCTNLTSVDVSGFNTENVIQMSRMFKNCPLLTNIDVSHFKTDNVTAIRELFWGCSSLTNLDISGFNTANVTDMYGMFYNCSKLSSLDLSSFNTSKVIYDETAYNYGITGLFYGCSGLTTIFVGDGWTTANLTESPNVFTNCTHLVGGMGTAYDSLHVDYTYAHIDGGPDNPGYLTKSLSMGDANGDGDVNIADAVVTVTSILGQPIEGNFYKYAADMNNDSEIDIFDVSMIVSNVLGAKTPAPALTRGNIDHVPAEAIRLTADANHIYMDIDQAQQYTAFQFDMSLPEGMSLDGVKLVSGITDHQVSFVKRSENEYRVVGLSLSNEVLRSADGHLIQLQISNTASEDHVKVSNMLFVTPAGKTVTGIDEHLNTTMTTDGNIYNLKGEKLGLSRQQLGKGIFIMNHKKVIIK